MSPAPASAPEHRRRPRPWAQWPRWQTPVGVLRDVGHGFAAVAKHGLTLLGLMVLALALAFALQPQLQTSTHAWALGWLAQRQDEPLVQVVQDWLPEHNRVTRWLGKKYKIAPQALHPLVSEAWHWGQVTDMPPTLILAVMAVESGFNPFAKGSQGAVGLMQIHPGDHTSAAAALGGDVALFDPVTNLRLGVHGLQSRIAQAGSIDGGLRLYGQASGQTHVGAYADKVWAEHKQMLRQLEREATR